MLRSPGGFGAGISELTEGQRVAVDMVEGGKGPEAVGIRLI